jgi:PrsW family intramembrane metalloprotease
MKYYPAIYQRRHFGTATTRKTIAPSLSTCSTSAIDSNDFVAIDSERPTAVISPRYSIVGHPLSRLSYRLLQSLLVFYLIMLAWSFYGKYYYSYILGRHSYMRHEYGLVDFGLMIATFMQSFLLLGIWSYFINRIKASELSFDAMIKYFASGFFLSASLALFWEMFAVAILKTFISLILTILGIDSITSPETDRSWPHSLGSNSFLISMYVAEVNRTDYATVFGMDHPFLYSLYILFATFVVAGFIEELCKYFGYRMVEHPDFFTREELEEASVLLPNNQDNDMFESDNDDGAQSDVARSDRFQGSTSSVVNFSKQRQSVQCRGAAITLAMVTVAMGFSCCENLIYVFHYGGESVMLELGVLLERSCFPIHPVLAAIQSIGVCQRELEGVRSMRLGRVILPAVILHGAFDFFIIFIGFIGRLVGQDEEEGDLRITNTTELLSIFACVIMMASSMLYLYRESGKQRERLIAIDFHATVDRSNLI